MDSLSNFRKNTYSQNGEDGVIAEIIKRIGLRPNENFWCVEFGAWDGVHLSNTFSLVESYSVRAVYIEGDREKYKRLAQTAKKFPSITPVEALVIGRNPTISSLREDEVAPAESASLDEILAKTSCPVDYDLLSIDIDSYDLEVWEAHLKYLPKIVVIEINSSVPPGVLQWHGNQRLGNSFSSTLEVAKLKGYSAVCHTGNLILVRNDLVDLVCLEEIDRVFPERFFDPSWLATQNTTQGGRVKNVLRRILSS